MEFLEKIIKNESTHQFLFKYAKIITAVYFSILLTNLTQLIPFESESYKKYYSAYAELEIIKDTPLPSKSETLRAEANFSSAEHDRKTCESIIDLLDSILELCKIILILLYLLSIITWFSYVVDYEND